MRMSSSSLACLAVLAAACNGVLGLAETIADGDGDGIADASDNCLRDPNPDQFDSDGDGIGDACASCGTPIGRDLDGDGYDDGCDRCIGDGALGTDADEDDIDDGCDPCIGLAGTTGIDADGDGIDDGCTTCAAPSGADVDLDRLDDGCDRCLSGPPHDEDGDLAEDGCDNCPGGANPGQEADPGDGDDFGLDCDPDPGARDTRALFDPFLTANTARWPRTDPGWTLGNDVAHAVTATETIRISNARAPGGEVFRAATQLARAPIGAGSFAGLHLVQDVSSGILECQVSDAGALQMDFRPPLGPIAQATATATIPITEPITLVLARTPDGVQSPRWQCSAQSGTTTIATAELFAIDSTWLVGLRVEAGEATFRWLDVVAGQL
jgi:hypothetical protein